MPAKSERQRRFMQMCAHSPQKARGKCPSKADALRVLGEHGGGKPRASGSRKKGTGRHGDGNCPRCRKIGYRVEDKAGFQALMKELGKG
jgi:hypothetical protein